MTEYSTLDLEKKKKSWLTAEKEIVLELPKIPKEIFGIVIIILIFGISIVALSLLLSYEASLNTVLFYALSLFFSFTVTISGLLSLFLFFWYMFILIGYFFDFD